MVLTRSRRGAAYTLKRGRTSRPNSTRFSTTGISRWARAST